MRNANQFIKNALFEKARQFQILTQQLEMVLPVNLLGQFQVCAISDKEVKICVNNASFQALMRFHQKIIKKRCSEILANRHIKITFAVTPVSVQKKPQKKDNTKRVLSAQNRELIESFCLQENIDNNLKKIMRKIAANTTNSSKKE